MVVVVVLVLVIGIPLVLAMLYDRKQKRLGNHVRDAQAMSNEDRQNRDDVSAQQMGTGSWATWRSRDRK